MGKKQAAYAKTKALISFTVTAKLISAFVFATHCWFFHEVVQMYIHVRGKPAKSEVKSEISRF